MRTSILIAAALALAATVTSADALTLINKDKSNYTLMFTPNGGKADKVMVKANGSADINCSKGCKIAMGSHQASYDAKVQKVWIQHGKLTTL